MNSSKSSTGQENKHASADIHLRGPNEFFACPGMPRTVRSGWKPIMRIATKGLDLPWLRDDAGAPIRALIFRDRVRAGQNSRAAPGSPGITLPVSVMKVLFWIKSRPASS